MNTLHILVPTHVMPDVKSVTTMFFDNLLGALKKKTNVHVTWLVYTPEKFTLPKEENSDITILDIHDFKNAIEVLHKVKPDIIYASPSWSFIDYALSSAAKSFGIPTFSMIYSDIFSKKTTTKRVASNFTRFFQNSTPTDTEQNKKQFMGRGRFFIYKYLFLLKTKMSLKSDRLHTIFIIWKFILSDTLDPKIGSDVIQFLENENSLKQNLDIGFKRSNLIITGNPIYDVVFEKLFKEKLSKNKDSVINVLVAPSTLYEHGVWTKYQRDTTIKEVIKTLNENKEKISVTVKIHPSSSVLSEYQSLVNSIDSSIPVYQKGDILDFLVNADVMISFEGSTAEVFALLSKTPIVICNFFNLKDDVFLHRELAIECKDSFHLISAIYDALSSNFSFSQKRDNFIQEFMYSWDGCAGERISSKLIELFDQRKLNQ